jgi:hypothetical protein
MVCCGKSSEPPCYTKYGMRSAEWKIQPLLEGKKPSWHNKIRQDDSLSEIDCRETRQSVPQQWALCSTPLPGQSCIMA